MKVLVTGGDGMLGHQLMAGLSTSHDVKVTLRRDLAAYERYGLYSAQNAYDGVDVRNAHRLLEVIADYRPQAIVNAVGIVKQRLDARSSIPSIEVNALFPHRLAVMARASGARLVHVSTDCVFSGDRGSYVEGDRPDPVDLYGRSKLLGEIDGDDCVTLRTSIIGLELSNYRGLVEWALAQRGPFPGYRQVPYSGLTTMELTRVVDDLLVHHPDIHGVWHVASPPISKYDLLRGLFEEMGRPATIIPDDTVVCDRTLCAEAFAKATGRVPMPWAGMLSELASEIRSREGEGPAR